MNFDERQFHFGMFSLSGSDAPRLPGYLEITRSSAVLTLHMSGENYSPDFEFPIPDNIFCFIGLSHEAETLILLDCVNVSSSYKSGPGRSVELQFHPRIVWKGPKPTEPGQIFQSLQFEIEGLHNVVGTQVLNDDPTEEELITFGEHRSRSFRRVEDPPHSIHVVSLGVDVEFYSQLSDFRSYEVGQTISVKDFGRVRHMCGLPSQAWLSLTSQIEGFLSFICFKKISAKSITIHNDNFSWELLWLEGRGWSRKHDWRDLPLLTCRDNPSLFMECLRRWLTPSEDEKTARWLLLEILDRRKISPVHFVTACQIIEILGRKGLKRPFEKSKLKKAAEAAARSLADELGEPNHFARFNQLILNANRASLRDSICAFLEELPEQIKKSYLPDQTAFLKKTIGMRNLFVHVRAVSDEERASIAPHTFLLLTLIIGHQAIALGIPIETFFDRLRFSLVGGVARGALTPTPLSPPPPVASA